MKQGVELIPYRSKISVHVHLKFEFAHLNSYHALITLFFCQCTREFCVQYNLNDINELLKQNVLKRLELSTKNQLVFDKDFWSLFLKRSTSHITKPPFFLVPIHSSFKSSKLGKLSFLYNLTQDTGMSYSDSGQVEPYCFFSFLNSTKFISRAGCVF